MITTSGIGLNRANVRIRPCDGFVSRPEDQQLVLEFEMPDTTTTFQKQLSIKDFRQLKTLVDHVAKDLRKDGHDIP